MARESEHLMTLREAIEPAIDNAEIDGINEPEAAALVAPAQRALNALCDEHTAMLDALRAAAAHWEGTDAPTGALCRAVIAQATGIGTRLDVKA